MKSYPEVFNGNLDTLTRDLHLEEDDSVKPAQYPARWVPVAVRDDLIRELERLEKESMIEKVHKPTDWVSPLVTVGKPNGKLRICLDPQHVNRALKRCHYPMMIIDALLPQLCKANAMFRMGSGM